MKGALTFLVTWMKKDYSKVEWRAGDTAQLTECLASIHEALGSILSTR